ncbi:MAG: hypothetical protein H6700_00565 [Myxococcales bacterium]|nr:hypothetical protein [Myxococcales bacterium]
MNLNSPPDADIGALVDSIRQLTAAARSTVRAATVAAPDAETASLVKARLERAFAEEGWEAEVETVVRSGAVRLLAVEVRPQASRGVRG